MNLCNFLTYKNSKTLIYILIFLSLLSLTKSDDSTCIEQWKELDTSLENWSKLGNIQITESSEGKPIFTFGGKESTELSGVAWLNLDLSKKRGITITFKPELINHETSSYPDGFAIVITSGITDKIIGGKNEGLGYEGIINAIAFEFDFIKNEEKGDLSNPHFSVNSAVNGILSSSTKGRTDNLFNIQLPNFYDNTKDDFDNNIYFEIKILGKKITVTAKSTSDNILINSEFPEFEELLEKANCSLGITSAVNGERGIIIQNFKLEEISMNKKGYLEIDTLNKDENNVPYVLAGEKITLFFYVTSFCNEKLRIFLDEINPDEFKFQINEENLTPEEISFIEELGKIKIVFYLKVAKIYTAIIEFKGYDSYPLQFIVKPNEASRLELCEHGSTDENRYYTTSILEQTKDYFYVPICLYDNYENIKDINNEHIQGLKIKYPLNIIPDESIEFKEDKNNKRILIKIFFSIFGTYEIFHENFINEKIRYVILSPQYISPDKSQVSILYEKNIIQSDTSQIYLRIKPRDNYNRDIPVKTLKELNCDFSNSEVVLLSETETSTTKYSVTIQYKDDYVILVANKPTNKGTYIFVPKVKCNNIDQVQLTCGIDSLTRINNCEFFYPSDIINTESIKILDEASEEYITLKKGVSSSNNLYISLEEKDNTKISEIILLDEQGSNYLSNTAHSITATLESDALIVNQIGNKYALILPSGKTRLNYSPVKKYQLKIILDSDNEFIIYTKFYFLDKYMTNADITQTDVSKISYIAFYKQNSFTLEAQETLLLFEIYELSEGKYLGNINSLLDSSKVTVKINEISCNECDIINHNNFFISIITHELNKVGVYTILIEYNGNEIISKDINIISNSEPFFLANENGDKLETDSVIQLDRDSLVKLVMLDKYQNIIEDNKIFNAFAKIKISDNDVFYIKQNYDGKIYISNQGVISGKSITLSLLNGNSYKIESIYTPNFEDNLDPLNSYGILNNESPIIEDNSEIQISLYLRDRYGNILEGEVDTTLINVYIEGNNLIEVVPMTSSQTSLIEGKIDYKATIGKTGDYLIKIFINNFPVECKGCHFRKNYIANEDYTKASLFILGNKQRIQILNSYSLSNKRVGLFNKNNFFSFYLDQRDQYLNEINKESNTNTIVLNFESENSATDISSISFCQKEKGYYELCDNVFTYWSQLPDGIYLITNSELKYKFYIYLTDSELDSTNVTPISSNSYIHIRDMTVYGKIDIPASFVLDIRNSGYKRIKGLDKSKITLINRNSQNIGVTVMEGNEEGLFLIFLIAQAPGTYTFNIRYGSSNIINEKMTYKCSCGSDLILSPNPKGTEYNYNGNYAYFNFVDSKGNECNLPLNWNPMNEKNFANSILKAEKDNGINYKTETYYNHITNTLIIYLENYVTEYVKFYSNIFKFIYDFEYVLNDLIENILDENHFYASISDNILSIKALNANYEPAFQCEFIDYENFNIALIRIINDDFHILKTDFEIIDDFCEFSIELDDTLIDAKGKYLYIVYYKGKEIFCENCMINNELSNIDMSKTKVYHKEGDYNYYENDANMILPLFKTNLPFFKVNLISEQDNLVQIDSGLNIELKTINDDTSIDPIIINTDVKYSSNGNIYIYLTTEGREKYWNLDSMQKIQLSITYNEEVFSVKYYVMDYFVKQISFNDNCDTTVAPLLINQQTLYIKRYDEDLELEIRLSDCLKENLEIINTIKVYDEEGLKDFDADLIPTDILGGYLIFLPKTLEVNNSKKYYLLNNNNIKSSTFEISVMPGYDIDKIQFKKDESMDESNGDKIYTYFLVELKDKYNNIITNTGRNLFINDIFAFNINNIPYRLSYDESLKSFRCQVPIFTSAELKVKSLISEDNFDVDIKKPDVYRKALVTLDSELNNLFTFTFYLKDDVYNDVVSDEYISLVSFKYITINPITEQILIKDIASNYLGENKFSIKLNDTIPKYSFYGFIPYIQFFPQICPSCVLKNIYPNYIYLIREDSSSNKYEPHDINKKIYLIKDYENPTFLYFAHGEISIESSDITMNTLFSSDDTKLYVMINNGQNENIQIIFTKSQEETDNLITFNAQFIDYTLTSNDANIPSNSEIFGNGIYNPNIGDSKYINFFIETRDDTGKLLSTKPSLLKDESFYNLVESIKVISTCYTGIYYIQLILAKSGNFEFYLKFSESQTKSSPILQINSIPSFPTYISLENKEVVNKNNIKFNLYTHNAQNDAICDERLNLYMEDMNLKGSHISLVYYNNKCELYIIFGGYATIKSNINNYVTEVNNNDKSLYNISPQFSILSINPNIFSSEEETLTLKFVEKSPSKNTYGINEFNGNKNLLIYKYISPNKIQLINKISNLLSNEYTFNPKNLGIIDRDIYILLGSVVSSTISPVLVYYQYVQATNSDIKGIEAIYFNNDKRYNVLTNFNQNKIYSGETFQLTIPLLLRIKFLDEKGNDLYINAEEGNKYGAKLILANDSGEKIGINLLMRQFNDNYFYIKYYPNTISNVIHLPIYLTDSSVKYFLKIIYETNDIFYSLLSLENRNNIQSPSTKKRYSYSENDSITSFKIFTYKYENSVSVQEAKSNINYICIYLNQDNEDIILNQHLDLYSANTDIIINDCSNFNFANSFMGCFELYINCVSSSDMKIKVKYNNIESSNEILVNIFNSDSLSFTLDNSQSSSSIEYTGDSSTSYGYLYFNTDIISLSVELFKTFINGEKIENVQISNPEGTTNVLNFIIPNDYFNTIPKTKNIMVLYEDGTNYQKLLLNEEFSISVYQKGYSNSLVDSYYSFKVQDPLNLIVGENIFFYLLIYDKNNACYYGDYNLLSGIEIKLKIGEDEIFDTNIKSREKIEEISQCEYIYLVDFNKKAKKAGDFDLIIKDGSAEYNSKIHISSKDIDERKAFIEGEPEVQAGHNIYLTFKGTDSEGNSINFYDLLKDIDIKLIDSEGNEVEKIEENYIYEIRVKPDNSGLEIFLKINNNGIYSLKVIKNGIVMNLPNEFRISIESLECSNYEPQIELLPIDYRNKYYYKEKITIQIKCKDIFGNHVINKGNEIFKAYILPVNDNNNTIYEFDEYFNEGIHYIPFSLEEPGKYIIDVTLNGKIYVKGYNLEINLIDSSKYNCMDKSEVDNLEDCDTSIYRLLLKEILGDSFICYSSTIKGSLYKCDSKDTECVKHTKECQCKGTSWQGFCYPEDLNPIEQVTNNLVTCTSKISNAVSCGDGSCRYNEEECKTIFECPLGFKPCGNKCILISDNCIINILCKTNEVLCWDLTCADGYDNCPTRITCEGNKVLCPDGTCQLSGHCIQPPNRQCENDEYQCADFSCVKNKEDCPKNIVCDPGLSLCENKTCNDFCKSGEIDVTSEPSDDNSDNNSDNNINDNNNNKNNKKNNGALIGGLIGGIGGALIIGGTLFYFLYWRKRQFSNKNIDNIDLNTAEQNLNMAKNKETIAIYDKKEADKKEIINSSKHEDIEEIKGGNETTNKESTVRVIKKVN